MYIWILCHHKEEVRARQLTSVSEIRKKNEGGKKYVFLKLFMCPVTSY